MNLDSYSVYPEFKCTRHIILYTQLVTKHSLDTKVLSQDDR